MAANFMLAAKMGLAQKIDRDRETKASFNERLLDLNNKKREWLFQSYMTGSADRKKSVKARAAMIRQAVTAGFSKESATLLEASGELGDHLSRIADLKGKGEYNRERVKKMDTLVMESLKGRSDEEKAAAQRYLREGGFNFQDESQFQDEFINAIFSANPQSLQKATEIYSNVMSSGGGGLDFGPTGLSTRSLGDYDITMRSGINKLIEDKVEGIFGSSTFVRDGNTTTLIGENGPKAQELLNEMSLVVRNQYYDPNQGGDWKDVIDIMAMNLSSQREAGLKVREFKVSTVNPIDFKKTLPNASNNNNNNDDDSENPPVAGGPESITNDPFNNILNK